MLVKRTPDLTYKDVTPKGFYMGRRNFLLGLAATAGAVEAWRKLPVVFAGKATGTQPRLLSGLTKWPSSTSEAITPANDVMHYNNYYEFGVNKGDPAQNARDFVTYPWTVSVEGEVEKPRKFTIDEILKLAPLEERIYRHRCVEAWSIVVPWIGYSFNVLAKQVQPKSTAKFVAFETYYNPGVMPWGSSSGIDLPYVEGLRMDEAMHPLTLLSVGMYGETLPAQDGAPVRMVIPWKYGFKSIKSLVKIKFVKKQPSTTWNMQNPYWYGFYSNVNPNVSRPRWSQKVEHRLGRGFFAPPIPTQMFNGYGDQVASMYAGMDLTKYY
jgi:methionine sulfoxide reductase catalytic subunit